MKLLFEKSSPWRYNQDNIYHVLWAGLSDDVYRETVELGLLSKSWLWASFS